MQKKKITAFLLALAMVSAMALPVFAQEPNPQAETAASIAVVETATPETAATEEPKVDAEPAEDNVKEDAATYDAPPENGWYQEYPGGPPRTRRPGLNPSPPPAGGPGPCRLDRFAAKPQP